MNLTIDVPEHLARFVEEEVKAGNFQSEAEVVSQALSLLEALRGPAEPFEGEMREYLKQAYEEGIASGDAGELDIEAIKAEARRQLLAGE